VSEDLYQTTIVDFARAAHGAGKIENAHASATVDNPLCGDRVSVDLAFESGRISALAHRVRGCLLCQASASALATAALGANVEELRAGDAALTAMFKTGAPAPSGRFAAFGAFQPVTGHRSRHDCVRLPFAAALKAATGP